MVEPVQSSRLVPPDLNRPEASHQGDPRPPHARLRSRRQSPSPAVLTQEKLAETLAFQVGIHTHRPCSTYLYYSRTVRISNTCRHEEGMVVEEIGSWQPCLEPLDTDLAFIQMQLSTLACLALSLSTKSAYKMSFRILPSCIPALRYSSPRNASCKPGCWMMVRL